MVWGYHNSDYKQYYLLECDTVQSGRSSQMNRKNVLRPSSGSDNKQLCMLPTWSWFLVWLTLRPWRWKEYVPPKRWWTSIGLHCPTSQKTVFFIKYANQIPSLVPTRTLNSLPPLGIWSVLRYLDVGAPKCTREWLTSHNSRNLAWPYPSEPRNVQT
jgi:hypothetical protein